MAVVPSDIKFVKAQYNNDLSSNGGRIGSIDVVNNALNNIFPNVTSAERTAGLTRYRKMFMWNYSSGSGELFSSEIYINTRSLADDYFQLKAGTDSDVQSDVTAADWAGAGLLATAVVSGQNSLAVTFDGPSGVYSGESVWGYLDDGTNEAKLKVSGTPVWLGNQATITISGQIGYNMNSGAVWSTIVSLGTLETTSSGWTETTASGTYDETTYPLETFNRGTVTDTWTITFTDSVNFTCSGANTGAVSAGNINTDFAPMNGASYYFRINKDGWGGTWGAGETVTFSTVHSAKGIWVKEVVPAGISSYSNNVVQLGWRGDSA